MEKRLTDNEIIKALKCCCKNNNCEGCPLDYLTCSSQCVSELAIKSLDLINRLQSQNKDLAETVHNIQVKKDALFDKCEELKKEVVRLNAENMLTISERNAFRTSFYDVSKQLKTVKSEAVKEFAERLKEMSTQGFWETDAYVGVEQIDNLVKEMEGENNA